MCLLQEPSEGSVRLSGYGVELAVKSTEYKAMDDSKVKDESGENVQKVEEETDDEVEGFLFGKLRWFCNVLNQEYHITSATCKLTIQGIQGNFCLRRCIWGNFLHICLVNIGRKKRKGAMCVVSRTEVSDENLLVQLYFRMFYLFL